MSSADPLPAALHGLQDLVGAVEGLSARVPYLLNQLLRSIVALGVGGDLLLACREVNALQVLLKLTQVEVAQVS